MRDPFSWSFPIGRLFGISVRIHFLFPLVCLGLILRTTTDKFFAGTWIDMTMVLGLLFFTVLLHELGHCFAARRVGGEANEVLLWPLGGLAACDVPHHPRAHFVTAVGGPAVNLLICLGCVLAMLFVLDPSFRPVLNPFWNPLRGNAEGQIVLCRWNGEQVPTDSFPALVLARLFWVSWTTLLLNVLLIGFPFDAGRMFQSGLWPYLGYRQATLYAVFAGFVCMFILLVAAIIWNEVLLLFLAFFTYTACKQEWITLESGGEESLFGYDFSQGYTSLERDEPAPKRPRRKKLNFFQRWLQRRAARKLQKEQENAEAEARRVDELLDKIQQHGKESLTDEENRFLKRYADRMKNK
jgi:stage IV sporulation protein FB